MTDYRQYRLNSEAELDEFRLPDPSRFLRFQVQVYLMLSRLEVGGILKVSDAATPSSIPVFIKIVCMYILTERTSSRPEDSYIEFSEDYQVIYRRPGIVIPSRKPHFYSHKG